METTRGYVIQSTIEYPPFLEARNWLQNNSFQKFCSTINYNWNKCDGVVLEICLDHKFHWSQEVWTANLWPNGLGNYFICKRFAVQTLLWSLGFVIQINLEHDAIIVWQLPQTWSTSKKLMLSFGSKSGMSSKKISFCCCWCCWCCCCCITFGKPALLLSSSLSSLLPFLSSLSLSFF